MASWRHGVMAALQPPSKSPLVQHNWPLPGALAMTWIEYAWIEYSAARNRWTYAFSWLGAAA